MYPSGSDGPPSAAAAATADAIRTLRHALNNPLTALLAEAQMLEMDAPTPEVRQAAGRIIELCRRVAAIAKGGDPAAGRGGA